MTLPGFVLGLALGHIDVAAAGTDGSLNAVPELARVAGVTLLDTNTAGLPPITLLRSGAILPNGVPYVFKAGFVFRNTTAGDVHLQIPEGVVWISTVEPHKYQFVTSIIGVSQVVPPSSQAAGNFHVMCIERPAAVPPINVAMHAIGVLARPIVAKLLEYRDKTDAAEQAKLRDVVISSINEVTLSWMRDQRDGN